MAAVQNLIKKEREFSYLAGSVISFPIHKSSKSKQRLSFKNSFNQHVQNPFAFGVISISVLPKPSILMASITSE